MFCLGGVYMGAANPYQSHPSVSVRFVEISRHASEKIVRQLVGKDAVHDFGVQSMDELRTYRLGGPYTDKRCFAMMDENEILHSAIYVHVGSNPIESYSDLAGDVMPILTKMPNSFEGRVESFHCYSISGQLSGVKGMGPVLVRNLHHFLTTNFPNAVVSTLSPMRDFDASSGLKDFSAWAQENDIYRRHVILDYLTMRRDNVQKFHMGNGAIIGAIRLSTPEGAGDSQGINRCMINYIYNRNAAVLEKNAQKFRQGESIVDAGLIDKSLISQVWGMAESFSAQGLSGP